MPKFTFIIPSYKNYFVLGRCLDSICSQTEKDYEIIVVNDGVDPQIRNIVSEGGSKARYYEHPYVGRRGGFQSIALGIAQAKGEFVYILNSDNIIYPTFIEEMYCSESHILTCQVQMNDIPGVILHGKTYVQGRFDRANYAILSSVAKEVDYKDFPMQQDDYHFFIACYDNIDKKGQPIIHHVDRVLAEHN